MALTFKAATELCEVVGDLACDPGGGARGVERLGVRPDGVEPVAHGLVAQILERDAEAVAVRELGVALPLAGKVSVDLDDMAHIDDQQEGRPAVLLGDGTRVAVSLVAGTKHRILESARAPTPMTELGLRCILWREKTELLGLGLWAGPLFGLHDETATSIEIDPPATSLSCMGLGDGALEPVVIRLPVTLRGFRTFNLE